MEECLWILWLYSALLVTFLLFEAKNCFYAFHACSIKIFIPCSALMSFSSLDHPFTKGSAVVNASFVLCLGNAHPVSDSKAAHFLFILFFFF